MFYKLFLSVTCRQDEGQALFPTKLAPPSTQVFSPRVQNLNALDSEVLTDLTQLLPGRRKRCRAVGAFEWGWGLQTPFLVHTLLVWSWPEVPGPALTPQNRATTQARPALSGKASSAVNLWLFVKGRVFTDVNSSLFLGGGGSMGLPFLNPPQVPGSEGVSLQVLQWEQDSSAGSRLHCPRLVLHSLSSGWSTTRHAFCHSLLPPRTRRFGCGILSPSCPWRITACIFLLLSSVKSDTDPVPQVH